MKHVWIVWKCLGEVFEGSDEEFVSVHASEEKANKAMNKLIKESANSTHWHDSYTLQERVDIASTEYKVEKVKLC